MRKGTTDGRECECDNRAMAGDDYHHGDLRASLLERAERVVHDAGADAVSLRELARAAKVSPGAPRSHFRSRQELLDVVAEHGFVQLRQVLATAKAAGGSFEDRAHAVALAYVTFGVGNANLLELMTAKRRGATSLPLERARAATYNELTELIPEGQREGAIEGGDVEAVGVPFFAAVHGVALLLTAGALPPKRSAQITRGVVTHVLRGLSPWTGPDSAAVTHPR